MQRNLHIPDENGLERFTETLVPHVEPGTFVGLVGTLGAGKTRFAQAFATAAGVPEGRVVSPTFVLCHQYDTPRYRLYHLDVYRLQSEEEYWDLGIDEYLAEGGVVLLEWADRFSSCLPEERLGIEFVITGEYERELRLGGYGDKAANLVKRCVAGAS